MIRTTITPDNTHVYLSVPQNYVGKKLEVLLYAIDELTTEEPKANKMGELRGKLNLTTEQYNDFQCYIKNSRSEWSKDI